MKEKSIVINYCNLLLGIILLFLILTNVELNSTIANFIFPLFILLFGFLSYKKITTKQKGKLLFYLPSFMGNMINGASNGGKSYGRMMLIKGNNNRLYLLGHLSAYNKKKGDPVKPGDIVAYVGNTGASEGAHLHVEVFECENEIEKKNIFNESASETIEMKWVNKEDVWDRISSRLNPFSHNES